MNSEEQLLIFNSILISTPSIVYTYDVEKSQIHFLNDGIYDQLGFPKSEIKTMHLDEFLEKMPSSDQHRYKSHIDAVLLGREKKFTAFDYRLQKKNGDWKWFSDTIFQLKTKTSANKTLVGYATDISNIRKKEERYQWEEIRLKAILENTREYYIFLNTEFIIQSLNKNAQDFLFNAYRRSIFEGYSILEFLPLETTSVFTDEKKEVKWYQFSYIPVRDKKDRITNVCFIFVDMTEIRRTNQSLVELNRSLEFRVSERTKELEAEVAHRIDTENRLRVALEKEKELNELKSKFIALVSHEFKTPMTTILMSTQMLEEYRDIHTVGDREKHYNRIKEATLSLNRLMEGVLSISRSESFLIDFKPALINVRKFLSGLITNFESNHPANKFELSIPPNDGIFFNLDSNLLTHILENLLSNAVKYSSSKETIFLEVLFLDEQIEFIVKNKGEGIPEEDRDHIFETFYRGKNVENISGTGLGLSVVKNFVALHKGTVSFNSSQEEGTEFHIRIPTI